jgi:acyl dehydratase
MKPLQQSSAEPTSDLLYLDDLRVGQRFRTGTHTVTADEIQIFAYEVDPQPFHLNELAAQGSVFDGLAASGWHTAALTMKLLVTGGPPIAGGLVGRGGELEWLRPTRPGDVLRVESVVTGVRPSRSDPGRGTVTFDVRALNGKDEAVQAATMKLVVPRRPMTAGSRADARSSIARPIIALLGMLHAVTVAGCMVGPDYRPASIAVGGFHNASPVAARNAPTPAPPLDRWWTGVIDPLLTSRSGRSAAVGRRPI